MRIVLRRLSSVLLMLLAVGPALAQASAQEVADEAIKGFIRPAFSDFAAAADDLQSAMAELCERPSTGTLGAAKAQFGAAVLAFSRAEIVRFGPLTQDNRAERLLFWPDRRGIGLRQVQRLLAEEDESATDAARLAGKSVAVQGFGALEFALYGTGADEALVGAPASYRCRFGAAVATNIAAIASALSRDWDDPDGVSKRLAHPDAAYADYRTGTEVLEELTGALSHGLEAVRDQRILPVLGRDGAEPNPRAALLWRSGLTVPSLKAGLGGLADFYGLSGIGATLPADSAWVDEGIGFELANLSRGLDAITLPIEEALADPRQARALGYVMTVTSSLQTQIGDNLSAALGLSVGFSSLDGD